jgi:hypothetical protein
MNLSVERKQKPVTTQPFTGGCRMKNIRSLLILLAAVFLFSGLTSTAMAGNGDLGDNLSLAAIDNDTFTLTDEMVIALMEWDTTDVATPLRVGANKVGYKVMQFFIRNDGTTVDTLEEITFRSFNDKDFSNSRVALYEEGNATPLWSMTNPGAFSENTPLTALLNYEIDTAAADDSIVFYFAFDSDSVNVDTSFNSLYLGVKITGGDVVMTNAGQSPTVLVDTLMYDTGALGYGSGGRLVSFDTKPPELDVVTFAIVDDASCVGTVNLGDSILITVADTTGAFELAATTASIAIFGGGAGEVFTDTIVFDLAPTPDDSAMTLGWRIPDSIFAGAADIAGGFWYLIVNAQDVAGNTVTDSILLPQAIDTEKPTFDGDSVWTELYYDANSDGVAAVGDTVSINAWMTGNPIGEVTTVTADLTNWGYGGAVALADQSGDRRFINLLELTAGALDLAASDSGSLFRVTATDNACNSVTDSNLVHFAIDNEIPGAPTIVYSRQYDHDANNIINIGDSIKVTVDASTTSDLATTCEVMVDFLTNGLGGSQTQCIEDTTAAGVHTITHFVVDGGIYAVDDGANTHNVDVTLTDDAGNTADFTSANILYPVDTDPPMAVDELEATRSACAIDLDWTDVSSDDSLYIVFWDDGDGWGASDTSRDANGNLIFTDTLGATTSTSWTTDGTIVLTHGTTYQFVVRTIDDANNREYNFNRISEVADCEAPVACITQPATGGAYGTGNELDLIAESDNPDIDGSVLFVRDADLGTGTPGSWMSFGAMTQVGGGGVFTFQIDSTKMRNLGGFDCVDDSYEATVVSSDEVGNSQSISESIDSCGSTFDFDWFCAPLPIELIAVNDTVSAQDPSCGFNVVRGDSNKIEINVTDFSAGDTYTIDVNIINNWVYTRVEYFEDVDAMPFTFYIDATLFPKGTQDMWIEIVRHDGKMNTLNVELCVPDEDAPMAFITSPADGQYVARSCELFDTWSVTARIDPSSYDLTNTTKVEFEEAPFSEDTWSLFAVITDSTAGNWTADWNNCSYSHNDTVRLRATFYDDFDNTYTTAFVKVIVDTIMPDVSLSIIESQDVCTVPTLNGEVDLYATINTTWEDIDSVWFVYAPADSPDIAGFYRLIGLGTPASSSNIYKYSGFDTETLVDGKSYRFRVIAKDISGLVMYDFDGDGNMDDHTFDAVNNGSDAVYMIDNTPVQGAIYYAAVYDGETLVNEFPTPTTLLDGTGRIYAAAGNDIVLRTEALPEGDTCCYDKVIYYWDGDVIGIATEMPFEITFNPVADGFVDPIDIQGDFWFDDVSIEYYDCFGQTTDDEIDVYVLDVTGNDVCWVEPMNGDCVSGDVDMGVLAVNAAEIAYVDYFWRTSGGDWNLIGRGEEIIVKAFTGDFPFTWITAGMADGAYELGAFSTDPSGNQSEAVVISVTLANTAPVAAITSPADLAYVNSGFVVKADVTSGTAVQMDFQYKHKLDDSWTTFETDYFEPWEAIFDEDTADGCYHFRVRPYNCADVSSNSAFITLFLDQTDPRAVLTEIAGQDVEDGNDYDLDLTGMSVVSVTGAFFDDQSVENSGIAFVGFRLTEYAGVAVREIMINPATAGTHTVQFDITGLGIGEYIFECFAVDAVGNYQESSEISGYISDYTAPTVAIAGYWNGMIYAYDWSGDAERVLFEYQDGSDWIGIGIGEETSDVSRLWGAAWWPTEGTFTLRVLSADDEDNFDDANALTATFVYTDEDNYNFGTTAVTITAKKNHDGACDMDGVVRVDSDLGSPVVIGMYDWGDDHQRISLDENQQTDGMYYGSFDAGDVYGFDFGLFFASAMNEAGTGVEIAMTAIATHEVYPDFGTNGYVQGPDSLVTLEIPPGAVNSYSTVTIMETWIPQAGIDQDHFSVLGNDDGNGWYIACDYCSSKAPITKENMIDISLDASACCFNDNKYAVIQMPYDSEDDTPVDSLAVAHWDSDHNVWQFDGIYYPTFVEGFNAAGNYVEFATDCLHGLYAVVSYRTPSHPGPIAIEWVDMSSCGYYDIYPSLRLKVYDKTINNSEMDMDELQVWIDGSPIIEDGNEADYIDWDYDFVSNDLWIYWDTYYEDTAWNPLGCGDHVFKIGVKNDQGQYAEGTFDFSVDCTPPQIVFENGYVGKNPTIEFYVTDDESGVDTSSIHVDVIAIQTNNTNPDDPHQDEMNYFLQTFFPEQITIGEDGFVQIPTTFELEDERAIAVVIYDGYKTTSENYGDPVEWGSYGGWDEYYTDEHGIEDCVGNNQTPVVQILAIDIDPPTITVVGFDTPGNPVAVLPGTCPILIKIEDDGEGFEFEDIEIFEDGVQIEPADDPDDIDVGEYFFIETTGMLNYCPTPGARIEIVVTDGAGNTVSRNFGAGDPTGIVDATLSWNPWNPNDGLLTISYDFTGPATVKIYDFGGDLVKTLSSETGSVMWNGATEDGTFVADGVYFGHIMVETTSGNYSTVVKIAIIEE